MKKIFFGENRLVFLNPPERGGERKISAPIKFPGKQEMADVGGKTERQLSLLKEKIKKIPGMPEVVFKFDLGKRTPKDDASLQASVDALVKALPPLGTMKDNVVILEGISDAQVGFKLDKKSKQPRVDIDRGPAWQAQFVYALNQLNNAGDLQSILPKMDPSTYQNFVSKIVENDLSVIHTLPLRNQNKVMNHALAYLRAEELHLKMLPKMGNRTDLKFLIKTTLGKEKAIRISTVTGMAPGEKVEAPKPVVKPKPVPVIPKTPALEAAPEIQSAPFSQKILEQLVEQTARLIKPWESGSAGDNHVMKTVNIDGKECIVSVAKKWNPDNSTTYTTKLTLPDANKTYAAAFKTNETLFGTAAHVAENIYPRLVGKLGVKEVEPSQQYKELSVEEMKDLIWKASPDGKEETDRVVTQKVYLERKTGGIKKGVLTLEKSRTIEDHIGEPVYVATLKLDGVAEPIKVGYQPNEMKALWDLRAAENLVGRLTKKMDESGQ